MPALMFEDIEANTPEISTKANYWFVRTNHGELYQAFVATNSIAMGYPAVGIEFVEALKSADASKAEFEAIKDVLKSEIKKH